MLFSSPPRYRVKACKLIWSWGQGDTGEKLQYGRDIQKRTNIRLCLAAVRVKEVDRAYKLNSSKYYQDKTESVHLMLVIKRHTLIYVS